MLAQSILKSQSLKSPMRTTSHLRPEGVKAKRSMVFTLTLTSLIDAFSILVIYLLINFSNTSQNVQPMKDMVLPSATQNTALERGPVVSVNKGRYFIDEKEVAVDQIVRQLVFLRQKIKDPKDANLIIQADKKVDYTTLSPVILAGSQAGFQNFKFAVMQSAGSH